MCRERAAQLRAHEHELRAAGAKLVFVGTGTPAMAADFAAKEAGGHPVLSDTGKAAFASAGMRRGLGALLQPRFFANAWRAWRAGFRQTKIQGDPWQQGGAAVFGGEGRLLLLLRDEAAGDELDVAAILRAVATG